MLFSIPLLILAACGAENSEVGSTVASSHHRVINGDLTNLTDVGMLAGGSTCTAVEIGNRCLLTSRSCGGTKYFTQATPDTAKDEYIPVVRVLSRLDSLPAGFPGTSANSLQVVFLGSQTCKPGKDGSANCAAPASFDPWALGTTTPTDGARFAGYGAKDLAGTGAGTKRSGALKYDQEKWATAVGAGAFWQFLPTTAGQVTTMGDLGGPVYVGSSLVGISAKTSWDHAGGQDTVSAIEVTSFNNGNLEWVNAQIQGDGFCQPLLGAELSNSPADGGTIVARRSEAVVATVTQQAQTLPKEFSNIKLTATPAAGYTFKEWWNKTTCPCDEGQLGTTCTLRAADWKYVPGSNNREQAQCTAVYEKPLAAAPGPIETTVPVSTVAPAPVIPSSPAPMPTTAPAPTMTPAPSEGASAVVR